MQKAKLVLTKLYQKSNAEKNYVFGRLYRNLYNPDFYLNAYGKIYHKSGNLTRGISNETIDGFSMKQINKLIEKLKKEQYYPLPSRRVYIAKKNGKLRPLGIQIFHDKIVQEILRQILESIYEPTFSQYSHGFRPGKSCQTALDQTKLCRGSSWVIEGDITGFFDNIDHEILLNILKKKIKDGRIIELINRFLKAGYLEDGIKYDSVTGTPQGGIISPLLANIYLHELDTYMEQLIENHNKGKKRHWSQEYYKLRTHRNRYLRHNNIELANDYDKQMRNTPFGDKFDPNFRRLKYIRYADDFLLFFIGPKTEAKEIKHNISQFLKEKLHLELNDEKTLITNIGKKTVRFLGYDIRKANDNSKITKNNKGHRQRSVNGTIQLTVPSKIISEKIKRFTQKGKPIQVKGRIKLAVNEIINLFNAEIRGLYNYYSLANNVSHQLYRFKYYHYYSLARTLAAKERTSVKKIIRKYGIDVPRKDGTGTLKVIGISYETKTGKKTLTYFNDSIKKIRKPMTWDIIPDENVFDYKKEIIRRFQAGFCELCKKKTAPDKIVVHHVKKVKDVYKEHVQNNENPPKWAQVMCKRNRKTLVLCEECHDNLHK